MIGKYFIETSKKVELRINSVRINRAQPVKLLSNSKFGCNSKYYFEVFRINRGYYLYTGSCLQWLRIQRAPGYSE